jgi:hypothetical protein
MTETHDIPRTRQILILGALTLSQDYCAERNITGVEANQVASIMVGEVLAEFDARPFDIPEKEVAERCLTRFTNAFKPDGSELSANYAEVTALLREQEWFTG